MWVCDGSNDCGNLDDEKDCEGRLPNQFKCLSSQFKCESGNRCIPVKWHCDGDADCIDKSDEMHCENVTACTGFKCRDGHCIPSKWHCDKQYDCKDGSDEELCDDGKLCSDSEFVCSSGACLNQTLVCNGKNDCVDGSDEGPHCVDPCENNTCSQHCKSTPSGPQCYCDDGFALDEKDNKICKDINECQEDGFCSHTCINTRGSYRCICNLGYELVNRTCRAAGADPLLIFSILKEVRGMRLRSKQYFPIRNAELRATAVDVDPYSRKIYWIDVSNKSTIFSASLDGSGFETILSHGLLVPEDIAVDYLAHNVYLTDSGLKQVLACKTDGKMCHVLHNTGVERPRSIVLDLNKGLMYWSDWGEHLAGIYRSGMDGSNRIPIVSNHVGDTPIGWPNGIALDPSTNRLYWADAKLSTIEFISLDQSRTRKAILNSTVFHPYSLTVFEDTIYWSDWNSMSLESCNKFTGHKVTIIARENRQHIMGIHVYHPVLAAKEVSNPCWSHDCSHMCLRSGERGYTCACPHGFKLSGDHKTCTLELHGADIFVNEGSSIFHIRPKSVGSESLTELRLPFGNAIISRVAFDSRSRYLFVADILKPAIYAVNMISLEIQELARSHVVTPEDLAFDWTSNNLYWIDSSKGTAEVTNVFLHRTVTLLTDLQPIALAISPNSGHMFIASIGIKSAVTMYGMDGKTIKVMESVQGSPIALALHPTKSLLYWADPRAGTISYVNYTSTRSAHILKTRIDNVMSVAVSDEDIYWTAKKKELNILKGNSTFVLEMLGDERPSISRKVTYSSGTPGLSLVSLCLIKNGGCGYICLTSQSGKTCACSPDTILSGDNATCVAKTCNATDFKCMNGQCLKLERKCDGVTDCEDGSDETDCSSRCPVNDFQCENGKCILKSWRCDNRDDCGDNSDEKNCSTTANCTKDEIKCLNGECVSVLWGCDGEFDCSDGTDESNCNETLCSDSQVRCDSGQCVPKSWICDGTFDCYDKSDEKNCTVKPRTCSIHEFRCEMDGFCLDEKLRCSGRAECNDESDEKNCPQRHDECKEGMFVCNDRACVYNYEVCDGHNDCGQNEDEMNCTHTVCQPEELLCQESKRCISRKWICDGDPDCTDGSDEERCVAATTRLPTLPPVSEDCDSFYCYATGECLPWSKVCDGHPDCEGLPDEGGLCSSSCGRDNGGCSHTCLKTPHGSKCMCREGFRLLPDNRTCDDIDECRYPESCSHFCINTRGSYKCSCADGYYLHHDHRSCRADGGSAVLMYLLGDQIRGLDLNSNSTKVYFNGKKSDMKGMDYDIAEGTFYWTELFDGSINRFSTKNRTQDIILKSSNRPEDIKYDWIAKNLYFRDQNSSIGVCTRDGNFCKIIVTLEDMLLDSLAIAPTHGFMFWTIWANPRRNQYSGIIERAGMDGSHKTSIVSDNTKSPTAIAVDHLLKMIYWSDKQLNTLERADFHGFQRKLIVHSNAYHPLALAIFEDDVYWADWGTDRIIKCHKYIDGYCERISGGNVKTHILLAVHEVMQPKVSNKCQNSSCQHMCVLTKNDHICLCEDVEIKDGSCVTSHEITALSTTERPFQTHNPGPSQFSTINISITIPPVSVSKTLPPVSSPTFSPKKSQQCPDNYCHEGAECEMKNETKICKCPPSYSGERCETKVAASQSGYDYQWVLVLLFSIVLTGVIILLIFLCIRHREKLQRVSENVSVKFRNQKPTRDGRLMDMDDNNPCEQLVLEQDGYKQDLCNSNYSRENSEESNFRKWPSFNTDSLRIGESIVNFFQNLKRNSSML